MPDRRYQLVVDGELGDDAGRAFEGMTLTRDHGRTLLAGVVRDQAALQGLLQRVSDLGLTLLSANTIDEGAETGGSDPDRAGEPLRRRGR